MGTWRNPDTSCGSTKGGGPTQRLRQIVTLLAVTSLKIHTPCAGSIVGQPVTRWAAIPSLAAGPGEHPLHALVAPLATAGREVLVIPGPVGPEGPRALEPSHFTVPVPPPVGHHVLLIDDTWTSGGHAQSAAIALRRAGAARVSVLVIARWLSPEFGDTGQFIAQRLQQDYNAANCPWAGSACPTPI